MLSKRKADLQQDGEKLLGIGRAASVARVFPVNVQPIEVVLAQEGDGRLDEGLAVLSSGHHGGKPEKKKKARDK